jgi:DNA-directed RNA polymerase subunit beta'
MMLEMAKPFVLREMIGRGIAPNVKSAKNMLEKRPEEVFDILEEITKDHPVLLNRAPTLHKLGIQAFYPVLIEGSAIRIHPAVCSGFNADFDGDQMAVHIPLSKQSIEEAKNLMMSDKNLLRPSDGSPIAAPASKEIALGVYYLTSNDTHAQAHPAVFSDTTEAIFAYQVGKVSLRQLISVRIDLKVIETTVGRIMFNEVLPSDIEYVNENVNSTVIKSIITQAIATKTSDQVVLIIDAIKDLGFYGGTLSGLSFGVSDAKIHPDKKGMIEEADRHVTEIEENFAQGLITLDEKKRLAQTVWIEATEDIADKTWELVDPDSSIRIVIDAKVGRTSRDQLKQLSGMRGLVTDPLGNIVELPVKSNFREGLSVFEYVSSSRGSRKGLTDTALKTADAGYLTRRLVDVAHDMIIRSEDCGIDEGIEIARSTRKEAFPRRIIGRYAAQDISLGDKLITAKGSIIDELAVDKIAASDIETVLVRSPLLCANRYGLCKTCYGWYMGEKKPVEIGMPVGVIAAQSIGEPGTQLTMRTKHSGGVVGVDVTQGLPRVEELFEARTPKSLAPLAEIDGRVSIEELESGWKITLTGSGSQKEECEYIIPLTNKLLVEEGEKVEAGKQLSTGYLDIKETLRIRGLKSAQEYLVNGLQEVYESQGIPINDRHFEVMIRKMSDRVKLTTSGDTSLLPGEQTDRAQFEEENEGVMAAGGEPGSAMQIVLGITRRALHTESWLSAASFEQTTDVLADAAIQGRKDKLVGLKENVIIGRLIPVSKERAEVLNL